VKVGRAFGCHGDGAAEILRGIERLAELQPSAAAEAERFGVIADGPKESIEVRAGGERPGRVEQQPRAIQVDGSKSRRECLGRIEILLGRVELLVETEQFAAAK